MSITNLVTLADLQFFFSMTIRLVAACILGGIVGYERENLHRPAGFRTHILVCVGSALVMVTSEYIFKSFRGQANTDPARLGAQVISGIGFLGAGTIIREGFSVKGLTTAASLWAVSCVGIAVGIGFYPGAIMATLLIFLTLVGLKKVEGLFGHKSNLQMLYVETINLPGQIGLIGTVMGHYDATIKNMEFTKSEEDTHILLKILIKLPEGIEANLIIEELKKVEGISKVY